MSIKVNFEDNSDAVIAQVSANKKRALEALGIKAGELIVKNMQSGYGKPIRQTGDLMRDVNYAVENSATDTVDVGNSLLDLRLGRRIVLQVTFGHAHRANVHGERGLHLRARMGDAVASQHQFGGTSAQIDHQIGGLDLAMDDAGGTEEA